MSELLPLKKTVPLWKAEQGKLGVLCFPAGGSLFLTADAYQSSVSLNISTGPGCLHRVSLGYIYGTEYGSSLRQLQPHFESSASLDVAGALFGSPPLDFCQHSLCICFLPLNLQHFNIISLTPRTASFP